MATCPRCKTRSRDNPNTLKLTPTGKLTTTPGLLGGTQLKTPARPQHQLTCTNCGWNIYGYIDGNNLVEWPPAQTPETGATPC